MKNGPDSKYYDWYEWKKWPMPNPSDISDFKPSDYYECWWGYGEMPDLNYDLILPNPSENGIKNIDLAIEDGVDLPSEIKTAEKVPIRISKGEAALPHPLGMYIGEGKLEKMNARGLRAREQREKEEAPVQMAAAPSPQEDLLAQIQPVA